MGGDRVPMGLGPPPSPPYLKTLYNILYIVYQVMYGGVVTIPGVVWWCYDIISEVVITTRFIGHFYWRNDQDMP